jgi:hypothetical protein
MLVGSVAMILKNNKNLTIPMGIRVVTKEGSQGHRISFMQVFAVYLLSTMHIYCL